MNVLKKEKSELQLKYPLHIFMTIYNMQYKFWGKNVLEIDLMFQWI